MANKPMLKKMCGCGCGKPVKRKTYWPYTWNEYVRGHRFDTEQRHWYIVRRGNSDKISCLFSAYSISHLRRKAGLEDRKDIVIQKAKRWHISRVFSGQPVFYEYKLQAGKYRNMAACEDIEALVPNEFHIEMDGEKILVKILS